MSIPDREVATGTLKERRAGEVPESIVAGDGRRFVFCKLCGLAETKFAVRAVPKQKCDNCNFFSVYDRWASS